MPGLNFPYINYSTSLFTFDVITRDVNDPSAVVQEGTTQLFCVIDFREMIFRSTHRMCVFHSAMCTFWKVLKATTTSFVHFHSIECNNKTSEREAHAVIPLWKTSLVISFLCCHTEQKSVKNREKARQKKETKVAMATIHEAVSKTDVSGDDNQQKSSNLELAHTT